MRTFRFGYQSTTDDPARVVDTARRAEAAGFDIFQIGDHVGAEPSPLLALTAVAGATERIRLGTLVLNNDLRHPVVLAQELATLDHVSEGRLEVGLGAGHSFTEYRALGRSFDEPMVRKDRLAEAVEVLRPLLGGETVFFQGRRYVLDGAATLPARQAHVPILVGVNGPAALSHAARHADIVAPTMLGRTLSDGQRHEVRWEASRLDTTVEFLRTAAGPRWEHLELHALVQAVVVSDDRRRAGREFADRTGMSLDDVLATPFLCLGSHEEIAEHLLRCRERWGITYYTVRSIASFAPVLALLGTDT